MAQGVDATHPPVLQVIEFSPHLSPLVRQAKEVVAFVVAKPGGSPTVAELDALCRDHIARFKRPKTYRFLAELPKSSYGKILKRELRDLLAAEGSRGAAN